MTPDQFISTWKHSDLNERQGAQMHFANLCDLLGVPKPTGVSLMDQGYGFEINVDKAGGGGGYADAWKRGCFAWEYKSPGKDLGAALKQLRLYASDLENPPLLIVSDMRRIELHTNWTSMVQEMHVLQLEDLADARRRQKLKWAFDEASVDQLKPKRSANATTEEVAKKFVAIAQNLRDQGHEPEKVAHFVNRMVFCMFAEDVDLLPKRLFERMLDASLVDPTQFVANAESLFGAMAKKNGRVGYDAIQWFNGGLFEDGSALPLSAADIRVALEAARANWSEINPSIMGTLFERGLDPSKRSQLGAHYTDAEKIMMIIKPVIINPLLREWAEKRVEIETKLAQSKTAKSASAKTKAFNEAVTLRREFLERLKNFRVLDPACGSGNFLYLALKALKDIEFRVNFEAQELGLGPEIPLVGPECVKGIEINQFAAELARVSVWIGEIQWMRENNFGVSDNPILKPLETIECRDALVDEDGTEAEWPQADVIVGNPPFLGASKFIRELGEDKSNAYRKAFGQHIPGTADLFCYWFHKAHTQMASTASKAVGLVAKNTTTQTSNWPVMNIVTSNSSVIGWWKNLPWVNEGAAVIVELICFTKPAEVTEKVSSSPPPARLPENALTSFQGSQKIGSFDIDGSIAREWLMASNPHLQPNSAVLKPLRNGLDLTRRPRDRWVIDFGTIMPVSEAALYERPFQYVLNNVKPVRDSNNRDAYRKYWWRHGEPRVGMRAKLRQLTRYAAISEKSKHFYFVWMPTAILPDKRLIVIAAEDDTAFGIVSSRHHAVWAMKHGSLLEDRPCYTPMSCFETFPFPEGLTPNISAADYAADPRAVAIAIAAARLNELRENWLNPPDLVRRVPEVVPGYPDRILPVDDKAAAILKSRTMTKLYNEFPAWLGLAHEDLDSAVAAAYGWPADLTDDQILERLYVLNQERTAGRQ